MRLQSDLLFEENPQDFVKNAFNIKGVDEVEMNPSLQTAKICYDFDQTTQETILDELSRNGRKKSIKLYNIKYEWNGKKIKFKKYGDLITNWDISHQTTGRVRFKHFILQNCKELCNQMENTLLNTVGVEKCKVSHISTSVLIVFNEEVLDCYQLVEILEKTLEEILAEGKSYLPQIPKRFLLTSFAFALGLIVPPLFPCLIPLCVAMIVYTTMPILKRSLAALRQKKIKVDILDAVVIISCLASGQYGTAAFMVWILDVADGILEKTNDHSRKMLLKVFCRAPRFTYVLDRGKEIQVAVERLRRDDIVVVSTGEDISVDGEVYRGEGMVDKSNLTGESAPEEVKEGDKVFAATTLIAGKLYIRAINVGDQTSSAQIAKILEKSSSYKPKILSFGEKMADKMVLPTLALGALGFSLRGIGAYLAIVNADYGTGIRVAAPTGVLAFLARAANEGIIVKHGQALEVLPAIDTVLFDKTGTLTHSTPEVKDIILTTGDFSEKEILQLAVTAEQRFSHPVARAILKKGEELRLKPLKRDESKYHVGYGIEMGIDGSLVKLGSARFMEREKILIPQYGRKKATKIGTTGGSALYLAINNKLAGIIELKAGERPEAFEVINSLRDRGIDIVLISGDNEAPTKDIANRLSIDRYYSDVLPQHKGDYVRTLQSEGRRVAMVGDGVNDSIAMSVADLSISMGNASLVAQDAADVILLGGGISKIDPLFEISYGLRRNLKRSFGLIVVPNTVCIAGALAGIFGLPASLLFNNAFNFIATLNGTIPLGNTMSDMEGK